MVCLGAAKVDDCARQHASPAIIPYRCTTHPGSVGVNQTSLRRRVFAGAAGLILGATAALALVAPAQAEGEEQETPQGPDVQFTNTCEGTTVTLISGEDLDVYRWTIEHVGGEGAWLEDVAAGETVSVDVPSEASELEVYYEGAEEQWSHTWEGPAEGCDEQSPFHTIITCDFLVFIFPNDFDADLEFSLTPNQDTTAGSAPDFVPLLDAEEDENGFIEIPEGIGLADTEAVSAGQTIGPLGPVAPGEAQAHGFEAADGLEVTVEATVGGEPVEIEEPVVAFDDEGLGCPEEDDGEGGELPITGNTTMLIAGGAAALLALGGGLFLVARKRRVTFTA